MKHRDEINAVCQDWAGKLDHIWSVRKANRIRVLTERFEFLQVLIDGLIDEARRATEAMRNIDPDAAEVLVNTKDFNAFHDRQIRILRDIAEETGQLPTRSQGEALAKPHLYHSVLGVDLAKALGVSTDSSPAEEKVAPDAEVVQGSPIQDPLPATVESAPAPAVPASPPAPAVSADVEDAAKALATRVWSRGAQTRSQLFQPGMNQNLADEYLDHAVREQWLVVEGGQVKTGAVNPTPLTALPSERSSSRGWVSW